MPTTFVAAFKDGIMQVTPNINPHSRREGCSTPPGGQWMLLASVDIFDRDASLRSTILG